eukprot:CAMPEP_0172441240 /NCGR_PEP_ID=MMETSP1065-20121228/1809_1 /TAXON_ID=265537 /ORGANISM="Amphiprora paludosa, Strain CCMP125" /LENGTH=271 /DNA_ID=CAMNT_0013190501 /DNA_START=54 /DNA_END=869 /DNA_ORIENTATION=+
MESIRSQFNIRQETGVTALMVQSSQQEMCKTLTRSVTEEELSTCRQRKQCADEAKFVQHSYVDHATSLPPAYDVTPQTARDITFPLKLHDMLDLVESDGFSDLISWQPHGRCFVIHKPELMDHILPKYFKISKWSSFQRQLNLYGFKRITAGLDKGGYYHEKFLRSRAFLAIQIHRIRIKGMGHRAKANPKQEPNFWNMPWVKPLSSVMSPEEMQSCSLSVVSNPDEIGSQLLGDVASMKLSINKIPLEEEGENWGRCFYDVEEGSGRLSL